MANDVKNNEEIWKFIQEYAEGEPDEHPPALFPGKGGFLKFGSSPSVFGLCWRTDSPDPDKWFIVLVDLDGEWHTRDELRMSFSELLYKALSGEELPEGVIAEYFRDYRTSGKPSLQRQRLSSGNYPSPYPHHRVVEYGLSHCRSPTVGSKLHYIDEAGKMG